MLRASFTPKKLRELLHYDPETGVFTWRVRQSRAVPAGTEAGSVKSNGRRYINVCNEAHLAHRLAWFYVRGVWPDAYVRVRDGDYTNCRLDNLFESTVTESNVERRLGKNNTSGRVGVRYNAQRRKWKAWIKRDWKTIHLGYYETFEEACAARSNAEDTVVANVEPEAFERHQHHERIRQRQRTAWRILNEKFAGQIVWQTAPEFFADVGEPPGARYTIVPVDAEQPVGPANFRWLAPPNERFDMKTSKGRAARSQELYREDAERQRRYELRKRYDLTDEQIDEIIARERGVCDMCEQPERISHGDGTRRLSTDHDHITNAVRGVICGACNSALGYLGDSLAGILRAALYKAKYARDGEFEEAAPFIAELKAVFECAVPLARKESA